MSSTKNPFQSSPSVDTDFVREVQDRYDRRDAAEREIAERERLAKLRDRALELAMAVPGTPDEIVTRARACLAFLKDG